MKCPYCGSDKGYYMTERIDRKLMFGFDDEPIGVSEDYLCCFMGFKQCLSCHRLFPKKPFEQNQDLAMGPKWGSDNHKTTMTIGEQDEHCGDCPLTEWCAGPYEEPELCRSNLLKDVEAPRYIELAKQITEAEVAEKISLYDECGGVCWADVRLGAICDIVLEKIYCQDRPELRIENFSKMDIEKNKGNQILGAAENCKIPSVKIRAIPRSEYEENADD